MITPSIFGRGFAFPFQLDYAGQRPAFDSEEARVKGSIRAIITTDIKERPMRVRNGVPYGTRVPRLLFENATIALDIAAFDVKRALAVWEPRIIVYTVTANIVPMKAAGQSINVLAISVPFVYRATNRSDNMVVPFRLSAVPDDAGGSAA